MITHLALGPLLLTALMHSSSWTGVNADIDLSVTDQPSLEASAARNPHVASAIATASSTLAPQGQTGFEAKNLLDHRYGTAWCEGAAGDGIGERITFKLAGNSGTAERFSYDFELVTGDARDVATWKSKPRVKVLNVALDGTPVAVVSLLDIMNRQVFSVCGAFHCGGIDPAKAKEITFEIAEVYAGGVQSHDTCLTELAPLAASNRATRSSSVVTSETSIDGSPISARDRQRKGAYEWYRRANVTASSTLAPQGKASYQVKNLSDGDVATAWCEGVPGDGIGETITMHFPAEDKDLPKSATDHFAVVNGYAVSAATWQKNVRVKHLKVSLDSKPIRVIQLADTMNHQSFTVCSFFDEHCPFNSSQARDLTFEILGVYSDGAKFHDTCLSELVSLVDGEGD